MSLRPSLDPDASLLADAPFRRYWLAGVADALAGGLRGVALPWLVLSLTGSPLQLGVVFALASAPDVLVAAAGATALAGLVVLAVPTPLRDPDPADRSVVANFRAGLRTVRRTPPVLAVLLLGVGINLFLAPWTSVILPTAGRALGDALAYTALLGAYRGGTLAGNAVVVRLDWPRERKLVAGVAAVGAAGFAAGAAGALLAGPAGPFAAVALVGLAGAGQPLFDAPSSSILQSAVDGDRRGTVLTVQNSLLEASFPVPLLAAGALLGVVSPFALLAASDAGLLGLAVVTAVRFDVTPPAAVAAGAD